MFFDAKCHDHFLLPLFGASPVVPSVAIFRNTLFSHNTCGYSIDREWSQHNKKCVWSIDHIWGYCPVVPSGVIWRDFRNATVRNHKDCFAPSIGIATLNNQTLELDKVLSLVPYPFRNLHCCHFVNIFIKTLLFTEKLLNEI